jgi:transcriptional regulator with XRE-family HTH domain
MPVSAGHDVPENTSADKAVAKRVRGTAINASALKKARNERGWSQETLAKKAGVSIGTVSRAERGVEIERDFAERLASAVGSRLSQILQEAPPVSQAQEESPPPGRERVELVFNLNAENLDAANQAHFVGNVVAELERNGAIKNRVLLVKIIMGSIRVILEVDNEDAERLLEAFQQGKLAYLDVTTVTKPSPPAPPRNNGKYFAAFGYVGIVCVLFGIFPVVRYPGCTLGLVLGGLGLVVAYRRKKGWIAPLIATILNAAILILALCGVFPEPQQGGGDTPPANAEGGNGKPNENKVADAGAILQPIDGKLPVPSGKPVRQESWGGSGFEFPGTIKIRGEHGGPEMVLGCWDDPKAGNVTFTANSLSRPSAGFLIYQSPLGKARLVSATYYPADGTGRLQAGIDLLKEAGELKEIGAGADRLIKFFAKSSNGGEWRIVYGYPK